LIVCSGGQELGLNSMASSHVPMPKGPEKSKKTFPPVLKPSRGSRFGLNPRYWLIGVVELTIEVDVWTVVLRDVTGRFQVQSRLRRSQ
jgi:hypothetical protein